MTRKVIALLSVVLIAGFIILLRHWRRTNSLKTPPPPLETDVWKTWETIITTMSDLLHGKLDSLGAIPIPDHGTMNQMTNLAAFIHGSGKEVIETKITDNLEFNYDYRIDEITGLFSGGTKISSLTFDTNEQGVIVGFTTQVRIPQVKAVFNLVGSGKIGSGQPIAKTSGCENNTPLYFNNVVLTLALQSIVGTCDNGQFLLRGWRLSSLSVTFDPLQYDCPVVLQPPLPPTTVYRINASKLEAPIRNYLAQLKGLIEDKIKYDLPTPISLPCVPNLPCMPSTSVGGGIQMTGTYISRLSDSLCSTICRNAPDCVGAAFIRSQPTLCSLYSQISGTVPYPGGVMLYPKTGRNEEGRWIPPGSAGNIGLPLPIANGITSEADCRALCAGSTDCTGYVYNENAGTCSRYKGANTFRLLRASPSTCANNFTPANPGKYVVVF